MKYKPATEVEKNLFVERHCALCEHDRHFRETGEKSCDILADATLHESYESQYPEEWTYIRYTPVCTAFVAVDRPTRCTSTIDMFINQKGQSE